MSKIKYAYNKNTKGGLMVTRRLGEALIIGDDVRVTFVALNGNQIKLLIEAPKGVPVIRENKEDTEILKVKGNSEEVKAMVRRFLGNE